MNYKFAVLGFLCHAPATGYELTKKFFKPLRPTRHVVYRYLNTLLEEGMVEADRVEQEKFPTKKVFHITQRGRDALREWLITYRPENFANDGIGSILWYSTAADKEDIVNLLSQYLRAAQQQQRYYEEESRGHASAQNDSYSELDYMYRSLVYDFTLSRLRENISFVEKAIRTIKAFKETGTRKRSDDTLKKPRKVHRGIGERPDALKTAGHPASKGKSKSGQKDSQVLKINAEMPRQATADHKKTRKSH
jgi:PadR family transcriptional regulator, regulatory protein AphA